MKTITGAFEWLKVDHQKVLVTYAYYPGHPGRHTMPNGDPGYPPEPAETEIHAARVWLYDPESKTWNNSGVDLFALNLFDGTKLGEELDEALDEHITKVLESQAQQAQQEQPDADFPF